MLSLHLTPHERSVLETWASSSHTLSTRKRALRAALVLDIASGIAPSLIATQRRVRLCTIDKWARRFAQERLVGLDDRPRSGAPRRATHEQITDLHKQMAEPTPQGARRWSRRMLARATGLSRSTIQRILSPPTQRPIEQ